MTRTLNSYWWEILAAVGLWLAVIALCMRQEWQAAIIPAACAGIVSGVAFARWAEAHR